MSLSADVIALLHFAFILFVTAGGFMVLRWPRLAWLHIPCLTWGVLVEFTGWVCPLTPLELRLRQAAGESGYTGGFIDRYLLPIIYPSGLTREMQIGLGAVVLLLNGIIYAFLWRRHRRASCQGPGCDRC